MKQWRCKYNNTKWETKTKRMMKREGKKRKEKMGDNALKERSMSKTLFEQFIKGTACDLTVERDHLEGHVKHAYIKAWNVMTLEMLTIEEQCILYARECLMPGAAREPLTMLVMYLGTKMPYWFDETRAEREEMERKHQERIAELSELTDKDVALPVQERRKVECELPDPSGPEESYGFKIVSKRGGRK
jgi:hypothetical protein